MKAEIKEVVTLEKKPSLTNNCFIQYWGGGGYHMTKHHMYDHLRDKPRILHLEDDRYYIRKDVIDLYLETDWIIMKTIILNVRFSPKMFRRMMNIRLQYSKKVKNNNNKKGKPIWHSAHPNEKLN